MEKNMDEERRNIRVQIEKTQEEIEEKTGDIKNLTESIDDLYNIRRRAGNFFEELKDDFIRGEASEKALMMAEERQKQIGVVIRDYEDLLDETKKEKKALENSISKHEEEYRKLGRRSRWEEKQR